MKTVTWSRPAQNDLARIDAFFADIDPQYAAKVGFLAIRSARFLLENPHAGPFIPDTDLRKWGVRRTKYILVYRVMADDIEIARVRHARESWQEDF